MSKQLMSGYIYVLVDVEIGFDLNIPQPEQQEDMEPGNMRTFLKTIHVVLKVTYLLL
jgi:hypothetical protein